MDRNIELGPYITKLAYIDVDVKGEDSIDLTNIKGSELAILQEIGIIDQEISYHEADIQIHWRATLTQGPSGVDRIEPTIQRIEGILQFDIYDTNDWSSSDSVDYPILIRPNSKWELDVKLHFGDVKFKPSSVSLDFKTQRAEILFD